MVRLGLMQPYFFPYLGHFSLIAATDLWVVFDVTQYTPQTWMNRNRVLHPASGWKWLTVPLRAGKMQRRIHEAELVDPMATRKDILNHLVHYRGAPHFQAVRDLVASVFTDDPSLARLNGRGLSAVCGHIGLRFNAQLCSELALALPEGLSAGDWGREICRALGADVYVNPVGGRALFDPASFRRAGVTLRFLEATPFTYATGKFGFEPGLSIIDVLMWNSPDRVLDAVNRYALLEPETLLVS